MAARQCCNSAHRQSVVGAYSSHEDATDLDARIRTGHAPGLRRGCRPATEHTYLLFAYISETMVAQDAEPRRFPHEFGARGDREFLHDRPPVGLNCLLA